MEDSKKNEPRSPLEGKIISRQPGQSLLQKFYLDEFAKFAYTVGVAFGGIVAVLLLAGTAKFSPGMFWFMAVALMATFVGLVAWQYFRFHSAAHNYGLGIGGERLVADELRELERLGCHVIHDVPSSRPGANVDHVVVGPPGVFAIETKTRTKKKDSRIKFDGVILTIDGHDHAKEIREQVEACCTEISNDIRAMTGKSIPVRGVVLFPVWYVDNPRPTSHKLWVFNPKSFVSFLQYEERVLDDEAVYAIASQLRRSSQVRAEAQPL